MKIENLRRTVASVLFLLAPVASRAQSCNSTGKDGAYSPSGSAVFDPVALKLNAAGDNVFHFTSINIPNNVTITMQAHLMKSQRPVVFLVSGPVNIQGTLNLSGAAGNPGSPQWQNRTPSEPGPGGYPGGAGARPSVTPGRGAGPGGGGVSPSGGDGCSASYTWVGAGGSGCPGSPTYGIQQLLPLVGGSGGGGARSNDASASGSSGGAGGGAIRICSDVSITASAIYANGGRGVRAYGYAGGAGSGGAIHLQAPIVSLLRDDGYQIQVYGGGQDDVGNASSGRIRIDANTLSGGGSIRTTPFLSNFLPGPYGGVPLPTPPTLTVVSINGITKKTNGVTLTTQPQNIYSPPDVLLSPAVSGNVAIVVKTTGIPNGTKATFYITTDTSVTPGAGDIVSTATVTANTATLNVPLPAGVDRLFVRAVF